MAEPVLVLERRRSAIRASILMCFFTAVGVAVVAIGLNAHGADDLIDWAVLLLQGVHFMVRFGGLLELNTALKDQRSVVLC